MKRFSIETEDGTPLSLEGSQADALLYIANCHPGAKVTCVQTLPEQTVKNSQGGLSVFTYRPVQPALELPTMTFVDNSVSEMNQEKQSLIETLVRCGYAEAYLSVKPLGELRKLAQFSAPTEPEMPTHDYSGMGPVSMEQEALPLPVMNFGKEPTPAPRHSACDYTGMGPVGLEQEALLLPVMNFGKEEAPQPPRSSRFGLNRSSAEAQEVLELPRLF